MHLREARMREIYRDLRGRAEARDSSFESQVRRALAIYSEGHDIRAESIIADDGHAVVLTSERRDGAAEPRAWRAAHVWTYAEGRVTSFDVYVLGLSVAIPP
jgi:hypothetical protein